MVYDNLKLKYTGVKRKFRAVKVTKWLFDIAFYAFIFAYEIIKFQSAKWFPSEFGGQGDVELLFN